MSGLTMLRDHRIFTFQFGFHFSNVLRRYFIAQLKRGRIRTDKNVAIFSSNLRYFLTLEKYNSAGNGKIQRTGLAIGSMCTSRSESTLGSTRVRSTSRSTSSSVYSSQLHEPIWQLWTIIRHSLSAHLWVYVWSLNKRSKLTLASNAIFMPGLTIRDKDEKQ